MTRRPLSLDEHVAGLERGDRAVLARALTLVESERRAHVSMAQELLRRLLPRTGGGVRVGITGVPGAGKSTFIDALGTMLVERGHKVAVLAVDPSSDRSGGSILGDKTRMARLARDERAFIRPSPSQGALGGVARKTREAILVCEAAGYDVVLVETVGVGQSETAVASMVDCFLLLLLPNAGDELQGIKRGILELADLVAVNKADGVLAEAAQRARAQYTTALAYLAPERAGWRPEVCCVSGLEGTGIAELWERVQVHRSTLIAAGELARLRADQSVRWMWAAVDAELRSRLTSSPAVQEKARLLEAQVRAGVVPPTGAAIEILRELGLDV